MPPAKVHPATLKFPVAEFYRSRERKVKDKLLWSRERASSFPGRSGLSAWAGTRPPLRWHEASPLSFLMHNQSQSRVALGSAPRQHGSVELADQRPPQDEQRQDVSREGRGRKAKLRHHGANERERRQDIGCQGQEQHEC